MAEVGLFTLYLFSRTSFIHSIYSQYLNIHCLGRENFSQATTTCHPKNESWYIFTKVIQESRFRYRLGHMRNLTLLNTKVYTPGQKKKKIRRSILVFELSLCHVKEKYAFYTIGHCIQQYVRDKRWRNRILQALIASCVCFN